MGKMKITKNKNRQGKGTGWLTLIVVVVLLAVFLTVIGTFVSGIIMKSVPAVNTDDYKVNGNMLAYYYAQTYNSFANSLTSSSTGSTSSSSSSSSSTISYLNYLSIGNAASMSDHKKIHFEFDNDALGDKIFLNPGDGTTNAMYETYKKSSFYKEGNEGTWFGFFMANTLEDVKSMLVLCEEAKVRNISLTDDELKSIDSYIDSIINMMKTYYLGDTASDSSCLAQYTGISDMTRNDMYEAEKLMDLATKVDEDIREKLYDGVTDTEIDNKYAESKKDFDLVDYIHYDFIVNATTNQSNSDYAKEIANVEALAKELAGLTDIKDFQNFLYNYEANKKYDSALTDQKLDKTVTDAVAATDAATIKSKVVAAAIAEFLDGKTAAENCVTTEGEGAAAKYSIYGISVSKAYADAIKAVKEKVFSAVSSVDLTYVVEGASYSAVSGGTSLYMKDGDKKVSLNDWLFSDKATAGAIGIFTSGDQITKDSNGNTILEGSDKTDFKKEGKHTISVRFVIKPQYKNEVKARDFAYFTFSDSTKAADAIKKVDAIAATLTKDSFVKVGTDASALKSDVYEDYAKGDMGVTDFDNWLFGADIKVGDYTKTAITMSDGSYIVAYYMGEGEFEWKLEAKSAVASDKYTAYVETMNTTHSSKVTTTDWLINSVGN